MLYIKGRFLDALFVTSPFISSSSGISSPRDSTRRKRSTIVPFVTLHRPFFPGGAAFGYFVMFPWGLPVLLKLGSEFTRS